MIILLDIDGVLVQAKNWKPVDLLEDGFYAFLPIASLSLNKIIKETKAKIILTTSHKNKYTKEHWETIFLNRGIDAQIEKMNMQAKERFTEILIWYTLNTNENFVILDDDKMLCDLPQKIKDRLILIDPLICLNEQHANLAIKMLKYD